jgi:hypothetical protein
MLKNLMRGSSPKAKKSPITVVSGLPRSGTSMMMKMLSDGGLEIVTDEIRAADEDNPEGYFEFEPVKKLAEGQRSWLAGASGKLVKVVSALLEHLPSTYEYKIVFMEREVKEILASQRKMLQRRNEDSTTSDEEMETQFQEHLRATKYWLARQPNMSVLYVDYNKLMADPRSHCQPVIDFLDMPLDLDRMLRVPDERLYRNRRLRA